MKGYSSSRFLAAWCSIFCLGVGLHIAIPHVVANAYRGIADMSHLFAILLLLFRVVGGSSEGISAQSQELYCLVFLCRYVDVIFDFHWYLTTMKVSFVVLTMITRLCLRGNESSSSLWFVVPAACVAAIQQANVSVVLSYRVCEFLWAFSIVLEPLAIVPQFCLLRWRSMEDYYFQEIETLIGRYVCFLGTYRALYIANWIHRHSTEQDFNPYALPANNVLVYSAAAIQALLYLDFAHYYLRRKLYGNTTTRGDLFLFHWRFFSSFGAARRKTLLLLSVSRKVEDQEELSFI